MKRIVLVVAVVVGALAACGPGEKRIVLLPSANKAEADGRSAVTLKAQVFGVEDGSVIELTSSAGLLTSSTAVVKKGVAQVQLLVPSEDVLGAQARIEAEITAGVSGDPSAPIAKRKIVFTAPKEGAPLLFAHAEPDRVPADGTSTTTIRIVSRRVHGTVNIHIDNPVVSVPDTVTLVNDEASFVITAPTERNSVRLDLDADDAHASVNLTFLGEGDAAFDLSGTFAQVVYGGVRIGDLVFLDPDPQCVIAPTFSLVHITQEGGHLSMTSETCLIAMPDVKVHFVGTSHTTVQQGFVDAVNARSGGGAVDFDIDIDAANPTFDVPSSALGDPITVGADLAQANDALPATPDDTRVKDDDGDGQPGVSLMNSSQGEQHIVYRMTTHTMEGSVAGSDQMDGTYTSTTETKVLDGESPLAPTITDLPAQFHFLRVDGRNGAVDISARDGVPSSITCADVNAYTYEMQIAVPMQEVHNDCSGT